MLQFTAWDAPALPVHDSFIVHHGYAETGDIEEIMRRAFFEVTGDHISKVDTEILSWSYRKDAQQDEQSDSIGMDRLLSADQDVSAWRARHDLYYKSRS